MTTRRPLAAPALVALALCSVPLATTQAQTVINSLPYTISTPGDYVLGGNLTYNVATSGAAAITFNVGNVTLDFAGHFISGLGAGSNTGAYGLYGSNRANITVQNGSIVGFFYGIYFNGSNSTGANNTGNVITNMRLPSNTLYGINLIYPTTCRVENCQINKTGGSTAINGFATDAVGIALTGGSAVLRNNQISTITGVNGGNGVGIQCFTSATHFIVGNQIDTCTVGVRMDTGGGKRQDNLTANCTTAFDGGIDAGGNN